MTFKELLEHPMLAPAIVAIVAAVAAMCWKLVAEARLAALKADRERAHLEDEQAERSKDMTKEIKARDLDGRPDVDADKEAERIAIEDFKKRVPKATDESARSAILAAVGRDPEIGKSSKIDDESEGK